MRSPCSYEWKWSKQRVIGHLSSAPYCCLFNNVISLQRESDLKCCVTQSVEKNDQLTLLRRHNIPCDRTLSPPQGRKVSIPPQAIWIFSSHLLGQSNCLCINMVQFLKLPSLIFIAMQIGRPHNCKMRPLRNVPISSENEIPLCIFYEMSFILDNILLINHNVLWLNTSFFPISLLSKDEKGHTIFTDKTIIQLKIGRRNSKSKQSDIMYM